MKTILALVLFVVIGFIASSALSQRATRRLPITVLALTGIEFLVLGVLLGPAFIGLLSKDVLHALEPVFHLGLGWAGLLFGTQLYRRNIQKLSRAVVRVVVFDALAVSILGWAVFFPLLREVVPPEARTGVLSVSVVLAITAAISSPTLVAVFSHRLPSRGAFTNVAKITTSLSGVIPVFGYGLFLTLARPGFSGVGFLSGIGWWAFANAVAVIMGLVLSLLTMRRTPRDERLLVIVGTTLFVGGLCYFLGLSTLYTAMIMGIVVGNYSHRRNQIFEQLQSMEKPIYIVFLLLTGAQITIGGPLGWLVAIFYVVARLTLRVGVSGWILSHNFPEFARVGAYRGLVHAAQGALPLAIALDYAHGVHGPLSGAVLSVVAVAVTVNEVVGAFVTRRALAVSGDVKAHRVVTS